MSEGRYQISRKQKEFLGLLTDPSISELLCGGAAGGAKTMCMCLGIAELIKLYPGVRIFVGRKTLKSLKQSTIATLLNKVHPMLGIGYNDFAMHFSDMTLDYKNGSKVIFGELETIPSDEDFARIGSLEIDVAFVDEAGEITLKAKNAIKSRVGRGIMSSEYGVPGKVILSCNPSMNFLRQEYYDPYIQLGGNGFQKWPIGSTVVNGKEIETYRAFLRMDAYDNPFLPQSYIDNLKTLPDRERKRLLEGDWNYADDEGSLFRAGLLDKAITYDLPPVSEKFDKWIGVDVAGQGGDRSVYTLFDNGVIVNQKVSAVQTNWDKTDQRPLFRLMADELVEFAQRNGFTQATASHIVVEGNGIGQALIVCLKERGWHLTEYTATHKSRSEGYYNLMLAMDSGDLKILNSLNGLDDLRRELSAHSYEFVNQEPSVVKKEKIKMVLGRSPDLADSLMIAYWGKWYSENTMLNPRVNKNRIIW